MCCLVLWSAHRGLPELLRDLAQACGAEMVGARRSGVHAKWNIPLQVIPPGMKHKPHACPMGFRTCLATAHGSLKQTRWVSMVRLEAGWISHVGRSASGCTQPLVTGWLWGHIRRGGHGPRVWGRARRGQSQEGERQLLHSAAP